MGNFLFKLTDKGRDYYLEWSTIVDAPVTYGMSLEELEAYILKTYGERGLATLPPRLARIEARGHSAIDDDAATAWEAVWLNRAGDGETWLTLEQMVAKYCRREGDIIGLPRPPDCMPEQPPDAFDEALDKAVLEKYASRR